MRELALVLIGVGVGLLGAWWYLVRTFRRPG